MNTSIASPIRNAISCVLAVILGAFALTGALSVPGAAPQAQAAVNFGTVSVSLPGSTSVTSGQSVTVGCTVSPYMHEQTANCTTDYCPTGCEFASGGCLNADGQCICFGGTYYPYYSTASVSSSNPSVARAVYSNGALTVTGYSPGTAVISVYGSLRLWTTGVGSMTVNVSAPVQEQPSAPQQQEEQTQQPSTPQQDGQGSGGGYTGSSSGAGSVSVSDAGISSTSSTAHVLSAMVHGGDSQASVEEGAQADEGEVKLARIGEADFAAELEAVKGTNDTVCFWAGESVEEADYMWTFAGSEVTDDSIAAAADFDLNVTDVTGENEELAAYLGDEAACAFAFAAEGGFPAPATFAWHVDQVFSNDARLTLYYFDQEANSLVQVQDGVEVTEGYATAKIDHGGTWVLADSDQLAGPIDGQQEQQAASAADEAADEPEAVAEQGIPVAAIAGAVVVVLVVAGVVAAVVVRNRKNKASSDAQGESKGE